ncbi:hypothetical protein [Candidatus Magnetaquiglobus chichijimensis]|uniref:hypothetical protein n=1 Tax=Candidatus Magnetaquiglobus chichijimensis TaxID=3141448 RepID=UPI003B97D001
MTEKEASRLWCCQARHEAVRQADRKVMVSCIGSGCMAWRWDMPANEVESQKTRYGHCGLAGIPEWT